MAWRQCGKEIQVVRFIAAEDSVIPWLCWGVWWQELLFSAPANDRLYQSRLGTSVGPGDDFLGGSILPKVHLLTSFLTLPVVQSLLVLKGFINVWTIHTV